MKLEVSLERFFTATVAQRNAEEDFFRRKLLCLAKRDLTMFVRSISQYDLGKIMDLCNTQGFEKR